MEFKDEREYFLYQMMGDRDFYIYYKEYGDVGYFILKCKRFIDNIMSKYKESV